LGPMAEVLKLLGSEAAWLVHGHDGMDEITTTNATDVVQLHQGMITHFTLEPEHVGLRRVSLSSLKGGDSLANAEALRQLVLGAKGAYRDIVVFNAAAALVVARKTTDLKNGITLAEFALDNGQAYATLNKLIRLTQGN